MSGTIAWRTMAVATMLAMLGVSALARPPKPAPSPDPRPRALTRAAPPPAGCGWRSTPVRGMMVDTTSRRHSRQRTERRR